MIFSGLAVTVLKYAEIVLAIRHRRRTANGTVGGAPYYISDLLFARGHAGAGRLLACLFAWLCLLNALTMGSVLQINAAASALHGAFGLPPLVTGLTAAGLCAVVMSGGASRIAALTERLVPFISIAYILLCAVMFVLRWREVPAAFASIAAGAFSPRAVTGGALGSAYQALRIGCSRGVFTNEAGMGTASIAHASAEVSHPAEQGLMGIMEVFLDTILMCTLTALVILVSGVPVPYGRDVGVELTTKAFAAVYGDFAPVFIAVSLVCFAFATVLGWGLYGARCAQFLFGARAWKFFVAAQMAAVVAGACLQTGVVWSAAETVNGLMVIPNLTALAILTPEVVRLTKEYQKSGGSTAGGGSYADIHQRKPV